MELLTLSFLNLFGCAFYFHVCDQLSISKFVFYLLKVSYIFSFPWPSSPFMLSEILKCRLLSFFRIKLRTVCTFSLILHHPLFILLITFHFSFRTEQFLLPCVFSIFVKKELSYNYLQKAWFFSLLYDFWIFSTLCFYAEVNPY